MTEDQAERHIPMTMVDWANKLNAFLQFNEREILDNPGKVTKEIAKAFAESEYENTGLFRIDCLSLSLILIVISKNYWKIVRNKNHERSRNQSRIY